jgi:hypothetical protein
MALGAYAQDIGNGRTARGRGAGLVQLAIEIPAKLHARFKAACSGRRTTMRDAILAFLKAEVAEPVCSAEIPSEPKPQCRNVLQRVILNVHVRLSADPNRCTLLPNDLFGRG